MSGPATSRGARRPSAPVRRGLGPAAALLACALLTGCPAGGGGYSDDGTLGGGLQATFVADDPSPAPMTLSLAPGVAVEAAFQVRVLVTDVPGFFGAAFRVAFDPTVVRFDGFNAAGSFIEGAGIATDFRAVADPGGAGLVLVSATRQGQFAGVDAVGSRLLIALNFTATRATAGSELGFDAAATRLVTTCPAPPAACSEVPDSGIIWSGGTLTAN